MASDRLPCSTYNKWHHFENRRKPCLPKSNEPLCSADFFCCSPALVDVDPLEFVRSNADEHLGCAESAGSAPPDEASIPLNKRLIVER